MSNQPKPSNQSNRQNRCRSIAILGTMSDAGKSTIAAGICRILVNNSVRVAPFKAQNMSNNASPALLPDASRRQRLYQSFQEAVGTNNDSELEQPQQDYGYGEIGTAQALQAEACKVLPRVEMNPLLLKSGGKNQHGEYLCSVVVLGKQIVRETYGQLGRRTTSLKKMVLESHRALAEATDANVIVMEGAGSCTELNLMDRDIVNLPLARALKCPWILVANIDCGGVFAQVMGTQAVLPPSDWDMCAGIIINKLRGEAKYFEPGPKMIENMVQKPVFVVPYLDNLNLPEEDALGIERRLAWEKSDYSKNDELSREEKNKPLVVAIAYPHIAIADDLCPLENDPRFRVEWRRRRIPKPYPHTTAVILPGSRLTRLDLKWMHDSGWASFVKKHVAAGGVALGICGGYQMLGFSVEDPKNVEGSGGAKDALGLLPVITTIAPAECKIVRPQCGKLYPSRIRVDGFELHCGQSQIVKYLGGSTRTENKINPLVIFESGRPEGIICGKVMGTYLHGILRSARARAELLVPGAKDFPKLRDKETIDPLDRLADHLESCGLDYNALKDMINFKGTKNRPR